MTRSFTLAGVPVPQGRPRVSKFGTYYSKRSQAYRKELTWALKAWWTPPALERAAVSIAASGTRKGTDGDNLAKQVLDAMVDAGVIVGDSLEHVHTLTVRAYDAGEPMLLVMIES